MPKITFYQTPYVKFVKTSRYMKKNVVSYWVVMPDGEEYNIWDLPKKMATPQVEEALISAFERGAISMMQQIKCLERPSMIDRSFEDRCSVEK